MSHSDTGRPEGTIYYYSLLANVRGWRIGDPVETTTGLADAAAGSDGAGGDNQIIHERNPQLGR
jgi:hypothetical protein